MAWRDTYCPKCRMKTNHYVSGKDKKCMRCGNVQREYGGNVRTW